MSRNTYSLKLSDDGTPSMGLPFIADGYVLYTLLKNEEECLTVRCPDDPKAKQVTIDRLAELCEAANKGL